MNHIDDIDSLFGRLRALPVDPRLSSIDGTVLDGIAQAQRPMLTRGGLALVAITSLSLGLGGSLVPASRTPAAPVSALVSPGPLAPSTLLGAANE